MTKEKTTLIQKDPKKEPQQLQNVPIDDVENMNGTNQGDFLFANKQGTFP